ncbi:hypothetical protein ABB02_00714 [Clostridiaceae bacterium JG1575]|nr:hypothetical protein ABB02_00714 [Clostridiaceae bacterium JG1575]
MDAQKRNPRRVLLTHALDPMDLAKLEVLGHEILVVNDANGGATLKELLEAKAAPTKKPLPLEKVVIFNGYSEADLKQGVLAIRESFPVRPIIAAVTDHSYLWSFEFLLTEHLIADRDWNLRNAAEYQNNLQKEKAARADGASAASSVEG